MPPHQASGPAARLIVDGVGTMACVGLGHVLFVTFIIREGIRSALQRAEVLLARDIHQSLVPAFERSVGAFDFCAVSHPSGDVGGDLVDLFEMDDGSWMAYIADVSGHGVAAGLVMAMVKSSSHTRLRTPATLPGVLDDLNKMVLDLERPNMFVTVAALHRDGQGRLSFAVAGHLPLLRVCAQSHSVAELTVAQLPLGIVDGRPYVDVETTLAPGETMVLLTDGLTEVFDARDREFGLEGVKRVLIETSGRPLPEVRDRLLSQVRAQGPQLDDQTLLLVRRRPITPVLTETV